MLLAYARFLGFHYSRAGCGGEAVRRIAAFPPHPLRTRFFQRIKAFWAQPIVIFSRFFADGILFQKQGILPVATQSAPHTSPPCGRMECFLMDHEKKSGGFKSFLREKGYYIVLLLCAAVVGVSGYFLLAKDRAELQTETPVNATLGEPASTDGASVPTVLRPTLPSTEPETTEAQPEKRLKPVEGEALNTFAADRLSYNETTRDWRLHEGIDLKAELGQDVYCAMDGTVVTVYDDKSLGTTVVVRHNDGFTTHYANLDENVPVQAGQNVQAGTVLGTVGSTACSETASGPHLHFAVYSSHQPLDPLTFLAGE